MVKPDSVRPNAWCTHRVIVEGEGHVCFVLLGHQRLVAIDQGMDMVPMLPAVPVGMEESSGRIPIARP
jgi:hypothetical protein